MVCHLYLQIMARYMRCNSNADKTTLFGVSSLYFILYSHIMTLHAWHYMVCYLYFKKILKRFGTKFCCVICQNMTTLVLVAHLWENHNPHCKLWSSKYLTLNSAVRSVKKSISKRLISINKTDDNVNFATSSVKKITPHTSSCDPQKMWHWILLCHLLQRWQRYFYYFICEKDQIPHFKLWSSTDVALNSAVSSVKKMTTLFLLLHL